jgi:hypothetical protein
MRRFRAPSSGLDKFFAAQFSAGYITSMSGFDLRQAQVERCDAPRRVALPTVMSISPTRLIDDPSVVQSRGDFKTALLP